MNNGVVRHAVWGVGVLLLFNIAALALFFDPHAYWYSPIDSTSPLIVGMFNSVPAFVGMGLVHLCYHLFSDSTENEEPWSREQSAVVVAIACAASLSAMAIWAY